MNNVLVWLLSLLLPYRYWYQNFYLASAHWRSFRERVGEARKWHCEAKNCREWGRHLDVHHERYRLWREQGRDVRLLCRYHHEQAHRAGRRTVGVAGLEHG